MRQIRAYIALVGALLALGACSARSYTHYLIEPAPQKNPALLEEEGTLLRPMGFGSTTVMKVRWNDGDVITEVQIPMLASGQRIIVEHSNASDQVKTLPATKLVPPKPSIADTALVEAYRARGLKVNEEAPDVSISGARTKMETALKEGSYQVALEWCELVLSRYPNHPEFMRAKGSILVLMGEREKAIEIYEAVEEMESDAQVRRMLEKLRQGQR
ncbi:MAG: tetratricopeptide repeat protein [Bradymonadia bacterium]